MTQAVLLGGLFIGVLSALPIVNIANCCCVWIVGGGMLAAYLTQQNESRPITPGRGVAAGFLSGIVGAVVWLIVAVMLDAVLAPIQQRVVDEALRNAQDMPPGAQEWMQLLAGRNSASLRNALGFGFHLFGAAFAALGGLLGASFFRTKTAPVIPTELGSPPPLPPA